MPSLALTPRHHLLFSATGETAGLSNVLDSALERAFGRGSGHGLLELGAAEVGTALPADLELLARLRRPVGHGSVHASRTTTARRVDSRAPPLSRARGARRGRPADDGR